jgi:hypothetical protein
MKPTLTRPRYRALKKIKAFIVSGRNIGPIGLRFTGAEIGLLGPTMVSLEKAGWLERAEAPASDAPFKVTTQGGYWTLTKAGRDAMEALPETEPKV